MIPLIDLVLGQFHDSWADEVVAGTRTAAVTLGFDIVLTSEREALDDDWPVRIQHRGSAGAIIGLIAPTVAQLETLERAGIPVVLMDPRAEVRSPVPSVGTTDYAGGRQAAAHLMEAGAERFVVLSGAPHYRFGRARTEGFVETVLAARPGARIDVVDVPWGIRAARAGVRPLLAEAATAGASIGVFAHADELAFGVYAAAHDEGLSVPHDVQVVGFDDFRDAKWVRPGLTTVRQPTREMAAEAVRLIDLAAHGQPLEPVRTELPTSLVVRGSTLLRSPDDRVNGPILHA